MPEKYRVNVREAIRLNPDWKVFVFDEQSVKNLMEQNGDYKYLQKLDSFKLLHQSVDFSRFYLLQKLGGISVDADAKPLKSFDNIPNINTADFISSYSSLSKTENLIQNGRYDRTINNSVILSAPNSEILKEVLDYILTLNCDNIKSDFACILYTTGDSFNEIVQKHKGEIVVLDNSYFESCPPQGKDDCILPENAILKHDHAQTWVSPQRQALAKMYFTGKKYKWVLLVVVLIIILWIIFRK